LAHHAAGTSERTVPIHLPATYCIILKHGFCHFLVSPARIWSQVYCFKFCAFPAHWRFVYFHGQRHARLSRDQTVYDKPKRERSLLITCLSPLLFLAPEAYLREIERLWVDELINESDWKRFIAKLLEQWNHVILWVRFTSLHDYIHQLKRSLQSTVMLTANVGFLAIPGVVLSNIGGSNLTSASQVTIFTSPTQIASCVSIQASIGSIVIGMPLLRRHMTKIQNDPAGAVSRQSHLPVTCLPR
jgi:hypothetical protein